MKRFAQFINVSTRLTCALIFVKFALASLPYALLAASFPQGEPFTPPWAIVALLVGAELVLTSGFFLFSIAGQKRFDSIAYRSITFTLLLLPLCAALALINTEGYTFLSDRITIPLAVFIAWLLLVCVKPSMIATTNQ